MRKVAVCVGILCWLNACSDSSPAPDPSPLQGSSSVAGNRFVQGNVTGRGPDTGVPETFSAVVRTAHYDRCYSPLGGVGAGSPGDTFVRFTVPFALGKHETTLVVGGASEGIGPGIVEITHIDEYEVEGRISGDDVSTGTFVLDACGHFGQSAIKLELCTLAPAPDYTALAVSPQGRLGVSDFDGFTRVFRRIQTGEACSYELDPTYGSSGTLELGPLVRQLGFDAAERLYAATDLVYPAEQQAGSLFRIVPGGSVTSCRYHPAASAGVMNNAPTAMLILRDGQAGYAYWHQEYRWNLASPRLGDRDLACESAPAVESGQYYTSALSVHEDGLLFLRRLGSDLDGPLHAEVTDLDLLPQLRFGGTESGNGIFGFAETRAGSRCPGGFCMAKEDGLALYASNGSLQQFVQWYTVLPGGGYVPIVAVEGNAADAFVLLEGQNDLIVARLVAP